MTERRYVDPSPLGGGEDGLPYSKGLMTRTLMATGMSAVKAYELARAIERDLEGAARTSADLDRVRRVAVEQLGAEATSSSRSWC